MIFYLLVVLGAGLVYGASPLLRLAKRQEQPTELVAVKLVGLAIALVGLLKLLKVY